ncbi:DUF3089 domain-containing protein [Leptospira johnsonii]|uniref:DUF3089 domain-containing protein n=1 Tax=Leptospira johnsonii TaxID=1917820 RepID=A0A2P2CZS7_9LEPT|nr:DUF3089 domain-containing protein [Leptospira johnsonii]GBF37912.1 hypothetical protein LPTSP1_09000 [Leptospira johnsonii]
MKFFRNSLFISMFAVISFQCMFLIKPRKDFEESKNLIAPDYSKSEFWAALPDKKDNADLVPENSHLKENQSIAEADTFYIHPTTLLLRPKYWNGDLKDESLNERTDKHPIRTQASAFNECCKVYAPRYRQAAFFVFTKDASEGEAALDFAYEDVKSSFLYYMKHWNKGRPFIIASHSQGTRHSIRLLKEVISSNLEYKKNLIASYSIGFPFKAEETGLPVCSNPKETGCVVGWNSYIWGNSPGRLLDRYGKDTVCVNPLSWKQDEEYSPKSENLGSVNRSFDQLIPGGADAKCNSGVLWIHEPEITRTPNLGKDGNLHTGDFHFFYANIRKNAKERVEIFLKNRSSK